MSKKEFINICRDRNFWRWIRKFAPKPYPQIKDKDKFLGEIFKKIKNRTYYPSPPQEYLTLNKGSGVLRVVPALTLEDLCVYYYCVRKLEKYIAINRISGTYGGFGLGGKLRQIEEDEINEIKDKYEIFKFGNKNYVFSDSEGYFTLSPLNAKAWFAEWNDFTNKLYFTCTEYKNGFAAELDISNFYDSIQLDNLEYKLRKYIPHNNNEIIYLLCHFLRFWNRHINFYRQQGAGLPQDTLGECSRILANFYLQSYDAQISEFCSNKQARYFRYADDQIIFAKSKKELIEIIAKASSFLMRKGLNFNQKKVNIMSISEFKRYYAFRSFLDLAYQQDQKVDIDVVGKQILFYLRNRKKLKKNGVSLLRRILSILGDNRRRPPNFILLKKHILAEYLNENYHMSVQDMNRIYQILNKREKHRMIRIMNNNLGSCWYTDYLYNLKAFFKDNKIHYREVSKRITKVRNFYKFESK